MKSLVCIPTYNEKDNIEAIVSAVLAVTDASTHILVIDDNSPDGTGEIVKHLQTDSVRLHLLSRAGKEGLGRAYIAGFKWAIDNGYDVIVEMDADFSHRPEDLVKILNSIQDVDFVVGSRWIAEGRTLNWGVGRKIISRGGSFYTRMILGYPLSDWTGGFNAWKKETLHKIDLDQVKSNGYSFQIELKYRALKANCRGIEVPIVFEDRRVGQSKMTTKIVTEAFTRVWGMRFG
jgi:dolichol-phosphate mannosyltransferase